MNQEVGLSLMLLAYYSLLKLKYIIFSMQKHSTKGGYGWLIHTYLAVLIAKLDFHQKVATLLQTLLFVIILAQITSFPHPHPLAKNQKLFVN